MADSTGYSITEAAESLNLSTKTIRRYIKSGKLSSIKIPSKYGEEYRITELPEALRQKPGEPEDEADSEVDVIPAHEMNNALDARQLYQENMRLAAQLGAATERLRQLEDQVKLLQAPRSRPWWKKLFRMA